MEKLSEEKLKAIFNLMSKKLEDISVNDNVTKEIDERRKKTFDKSKPDSYFYEILVRDIFGASLKARALTARWPYFKEAFSDFDINKVSEKKVEDLMENPHIIRNRRKLEACICHAKRMKEISANFGSFGEFLAKHMGNKNELIETIKRVFPKFVGNAVALDYLKDIGLDIIKPDRHVLRILFRLGFIESEELTNRNICEAIEVAEAIKRATSEKLMVIDAVFWMYGGGGNGHVKRAICRKEAPLCNECPITFYCRFYDLKRT